MKLSTDSAGVFTVTRAAAGPGDSIFARSSAWEVNVTVGTTCSAALRRPGRLSTD